MSIDAITIIAIVFTAFAAALFIAPRLPFLYRARFPRRETGARAVGEQLWGFLDAITDGMIIIDERGLIVAFNPAATRIFGHAAGDVVGKNVNILIPEPHQDQHDGYIQRYIQTGQGRIVGAAPRELGGLHKDGRVFPIELTVSEVRLGSRRLFVGVVRDIAQRKEAEERIMYLAHYDALTALPSRTLFHDRARHALAQANRDEKLVAVMVLDVDYFKNVNDGYGHEAGDALLRLIAERVSMALRNCDTVARLGGDEFAVILENLPHIDHASIVAQKILDVMEEPFTISGNETRVTVSIGITMYPFDNKDIDSLLRDADAAMYRAKYSGRNNFQYFSYDLTASARSVQDMAEEMARALERGELLLHYQPRVDLLSGQITGVEALLRWNHPEKGLLWPADFLPAVEKGRLIYAMDKWVLTTACRQNKAWQEAGLENVCVTVNISTNSLRRKGLPAIVGKILKETGLPPQYLELDVPGMDFTGVEREHFKNRLDELKELGVRIALADYGTASPFVSSLQRLPLDVLKIDRAFVRDATVDLDHAAITQAIVNLARALKLKVVAEGVETGDELALLRNYGCDQIQGYFFSKPVTPEEFARQLLEGKRLS